MAFDWDMASGGSSAGGGLGGSIGSIIGDLFAGKDREEQLRLLKEIEGLYGGLDPRVTAQLEEAITLGPSAMEGLTEDPTVRNRQLQAMNSILDVGTAGGMDAQSRARLAEAQSRSAQQERAGRGALQQQAQTRGQGNSLTSYVTQLSAGQGAAQRAGMESVQAAGDASARALQALAQGGGLAGQVRGQDFQAASAKASATDAINAFNARNRQDVSGRNIDRGMQAQQQTFANGMSRANAQADGKRGQVGYYQSEAERKRRLGYGVGSTVGQVGGSLLGFL